ncbi:MAG: inositol monophosphatase family protein [Acidimicrobiia bacterium]|nr:inositol monophosphatase family protein [Acidimicrobiia bacterium]
MRIHPSDACDLGSSFVGASGFLVLPLGWADTGAFGAAVLDLCLVACGSLDGYVDCRGSDAHGVWDYAGALLAPRQAGAVVTDAAGRDLVLDHESRRTPVAAATPDLLEQLLESRRRSVDDGTRHRTP